MPWITFRRCSDNKTMRKLIKLKSVKNGAGCRIRTDDRLITNQVLYQLS